MDARKECKGKKDIETFLPCKVMGNSPHIKLYCTLYRYSSKLTFLSAGALLDDNLQLRLLNRSIIASLSTPEI